MKITCALFVLALGSYVHAADVGNCKTESTAGQCLDPAASSGCTNQACSGGTPQCKSVVTLTNWVASAVTRTCVATGAPGCTAVAATTATGPETLCYEATTSISSIANKGPFKCFVCNTPAAGNCAPAQSPGTSEGGGFGDATNTCPGSCWTKVTFAANTATTVARGCNAPTPPNNFNTANGNGDVVTTCNSGQKCNSAAAVTTAPTSTTTTTAAPTPAATTATTTATPGAPAAATTTVAAATTTAAAGGGSGASTIAPATFAIFLVSVIIMKMFG